MKRIRPHATLHLGSSTDRGHGGRNRGHRGLLLGAEQNAYPLLQVEHEGGVNEVSAGQAIIAHRGEWVRYSTPHPGGAEYVAICLPAFSPETVNRDD